MPRHRSGHLQNLSEFQVAQATPEMTRIQFESGTAQALDAITLDTPVDSFVKAASVFGYRKAGDWMLLAQGHQIFSHGSSRNLRIGFARGQWDRLRVDLRDSASSPPIPIAGVKIHLAAVEELPVQPFELKIVDRLELGDSSRLRIRLPYRNLYVLRLELQTPTPAFKRKLQLHERQISGDRILMQKLDESVISRLLGEEGASDKPAGFEVSRLIPRNEIFLDVESGAGGPLEIETVRALAVPNFAVFRSSGEQELRFLFGNPIARRPDYELEAFNDLLGGTVKTPVVVSTPPTQNPDYLRRNHCPVSPARRRPLTPGAGDHENGSESASPAFSRWSWI